MLPLREEQGPAKAYAFYIAYTRDGGRNRAVTFCFNGGPGSSSVWLHLGAFGPLRVDTPDDPTQPALPGRLVRNAESLLDVTDLVFIDPVMTGYSRPVRGEKREQFHGVTEDVNWVGEFVRLWTTRNGRWDSAKFLAGESYGTMRAAALVGHLQNRHGMYFNGIILVSSVLNGVTLMFEQGNDLSHLLVMPTLAATAWYHRRLEPALQKSLPKTIAAAREFGARGLGLEYDEKMVGFASRNAATAGVSGRVEFRQADIFKTDFSQADVVTMYLLPDLNLRLRSTLMAMTPGTRIVSHQFSMANWKPDETSWVQGRPAYLWIVPANAGGAWEATYSRKAGAAASIAFTLEQQFQELKGTAQLGDIRTSLRTPSLRGRELQFGFTDADGVLRQVTATIDGGRMQGRIAGPDGSSAFTAERKGEAPPVGGSAPVTGDELSNAMRQLGE